MSLSVDILEIFVEAQQKVDQLGFFYAHCALRRESKLESNRAYYSKNRRNSPKQLAHKERYRTSEKGREKHAQHCREYRARLRAKRLQGVKGP